MSITNYFPTYTHRKYLFAYPNIIPSPLYETPLLKEIFTQTLLANYISTKYTTTQNFTYISTPILLKISLIVALVTIPTFIVTASFFSIIYAPTSALVITTVATKAIASLITNYLTNDGDMALSKESYQFGQLFAALFVTVPPIAGLAASFYICKWLIPYPIGIGLLIADALLKNFVYIQSETTKIERQHTHQQLINARDASEKFIDPLHNIPIDPDKINHSQYIVIENRIYHLFPLLTHIFTAQDYDTITHPITKDVMSEDEKRTFLLPIEQFFSIPHGEFSHLWKTDSPASVFLDLFSEDLLTRVTSLSHQFRNVDFKPFVDFILSPPYINTTVENHLPHRQWLEEQTITRSNHLNTEMEKLSFFCLLTMMKIISIWYPNPRIIPSLRDLAGSGYSCTSD